MRVSPLPTTKLGFAIFGLSCYLVFAFALLLGPFSQNNATVRFLPDFFGKSLLMILMPL